MEEKNQIAVLSVCLSVLQHGPRVSLGCPYGQIAVQFTHKLRQQEAPTRSSAAAQQIVD
jgi:hypothetical protein